MEASNAGWPRTQLASLDTPTIFVTGIDSAGNESGPVPIRNVEWTATTNKPAFGPSPHLVFRKGLLTSPWTDLLASPSSTAAGVDALAVRSMASGDWRVASREGLSQRMNHAMAYDSARDRVVLFGGENGFRLVGETWEWNGQSWRQVIPTDPEGYGNPSARFRHAMAYDITRGQIVLFGGEDSVAFFGGGWAWDGTSWGRLDPTDPELDGDPSPRRDHAMAYDTVGRRLVLFGGLDSSSLVADTWIWNGESWRRLSQNDLEEGQSPDARYFHAMAYDTIRGRIVLFGGVGSSGALDDTWELSGRRWQLMPLSEPARDRPVALAGHAAAFDSVRQEVVMMGGLDGPMGVDDTWVWSGDGWRRVSADRERDGNPAARAEHAAVYDSARKRVVVFGGADTSVSSLDDTWEWNGYSWRRREPRDPEGDGDPAARVEHAMAFDSLRAQTILFGGKGLPGFLDDTWAWDGDSWERMVPSDPEDDGNPSPRSGHVMVYDSARGLVMDYLISTIRGLGTGADGAGLAPRTPRAMARRLPALITRWCTTVHVAGSCCLVGSIAPPLLSPRPGSG